MSAITKSAISKRRIDNSAIRPRWLFWMLFWYFPICGVCLHEGMIMFLGSFLAFPNRRTIYRSLIHFHRRLFHQPPGPVMHKLLLIAPVVICFSMMFFGVALSILRLYLHLPDPPFAVMALNLSVLIGLIIMMVHFYNANRINGLNSSSPP
jgi:hypothetical protein